MMDMKVVLLQWFIEFLLKRVLIESLRLNWPVIKNKNMSNKELVEGLHKPIIRKF